MSHGAPSSAPSGRCSYDDAPPADMKICCDVCLHRASTASQSRVGVGAYRDVATPASAASAITPRMCERPPSSIGEARLRPRGQTAGLRTRPF